VPGVHFLDRTSDASHNRSVFTLAGEVAAVTAGLERLVAAALVEIDMRTQTGEHPRIGAVDVVPFVPLGTPPLRTASASPATFGRRIAERFDLPVYLYAAAATRPGRVRLADVRRGQYEGLVAEIATAGREPDFGPARMHPPRRCDGRRGTAVPRRLEHQPRVDGPRPREADRAPRSASRRAACRRSRQRVSGSRSSRARRSR
jgi:glutamate formiminotransferase